MRDTQLDVDVPVSSTERGAEELRTPTLLSPPESKTPPTATHKRHQNGFEQTVHDRGSEPVDATALSRALEQFEQAGRQRERTPGASPSRKRQRVYGDRLVNRCKGCIDSRMRPSKTLKWLPEVQKLTSCNRFIPNRSGQDLQASFTLLHDEGSPATPSRSARRTPHNELHFQRSMTIPTVHNIYSLLTFSFS